ncbi:mitochondrial dynamics protein MID51-like [Lineus longissimus]|uniref:mitochondrial dynamics protein MID51-like n=1 Tax=Lineus longissimus TaxID=88925 RepID=UPI00315D2C09
MLTDTNMASRPLEFHPIKTCETCGKNDLMTQEALRQHVTDKEDNYHQGPDSYPIVCACGRRFMTAEEITTHGGECPLKMDMHLQGHSASEPARNNVGHEYLRRSLNDYFEQHVKLDQNEMRHAKQVAKEISEHLLDYLKTRFEFKKMNLGEIEPVGSSFDGLKVAPADEFDMIIPIKLYAFDWELIDGRKAVVDGRRLKNAQGFWLIKKKTTTRETTMDPYLVHREDGDYIAPGNVIRDLQRKIHKIIRKFKHPEGVEKVKAGVKGPSLYVQVEYTSTLRSAMTKFDLDFVLEVRVGDAPDIPKLVAKRHPSITQQGFLGDNPMALLWQESSAIKESLRIREIREEGPFDCRKKCWKLVKALAMKNKHLGSLCTYFYKTLFLHLLDAIPNDADWYEARLADRFLDVFKKMEKVLHRKWMPLYFTRDVNMLLPRYDEMQVENVYYYVRKMNAEGSHLQLFYGGPSSTEKKKEKVFTVYSRQRKQKAQDGGAAARPKTTNPKSRKRKSAPAKKGSAKPASTKQAKSKPKATVVNLDSVDLSGFGEPVYEYTDDFEDYGVAYDEYDDYADEFF